MLKCTALATALCVTATVRASAQTIPAEWWRADTATVRLGPDRFPDLPTAIRTDLERRQCRIPQPSEFFRVTRPDNVIRGAFTGPNRVDWAVLCSVRHVSTILVYSGDGGIAKDSLESKPDIHQLQGLGDDRIGYSRAISVANAAEIRRYATTYPDGVRPPTDIDHDGIDEGFLGKASVVHYFYRGRWLRLQGAD